MRVLGGRTIPIGIEGSDTVDLLKHKILDLEGILPEHQQLVFSGKTLNKRHTLNHYNVIKESTIFLVLQVNGGGFCGHGHANFDGCFRPAQEVRGSLFE